MRKLGLLVILVAGVAVAGGLNVDPTVRYEFTDCASGGSASQTVAGGTYLFRVTTEDVWVCWASTCASGGEKFPAGMAMVLSFGTGGQALSCRSSSSTADVILTRATQ